MKARDIIVGTITQIAANQTELVNQESAKPTRKVAAAGAGALAGIPVGALVSIGITAALGVPVPEYVGDAIVGVVTGAFAVGSAYMAKEKKQAMAGGDR